MIRSPNDKMSARLRDKVIVFPSRNNTVFLFPKYDSINAIINWKIPSITVSTGVN